MDIFVKCLLLTNREGPLGSSKRVPIYCRHSVVRPFVFQNIIISDCRSSGCTLNFRGIFCRDRAALDVQHDLITGWLYPNAVTFPMGFVSQSISLMVVMGLSRRFGMLQILMSLDMLDV